ncbi:MAG: DUF1460 domain-containing protein [Paramuribaculum sp.]|nr:DUF1460 domain-containing protein [Paramuribaculum sp.]MDE7452351.1 DUF1460 domain-containing protein [Paramuribaculum sp.]
MRYGSILISALSLLLINISAYAVSPSQVHFGNESNDTIAITTLLVNNLKPGTSLNNYMVIIGTSFEGTPYAGGTLEGSPEVLRVNLQGMDCVSFVETVAALAQTLGERRTSWIDFIYNLERLRYRGGNMNGYASRLHYFSDWVVDNHHRGNITEVTDRIANASYLVKTLDFMTQNRDKYDALADSTEYERIKNIQVGFRSHRFPYIKSTNIGAANILPGDIIAVVSKTPGLDVSHLGIAVEVNGKIHLLHASSKEGKVCVSDVPLTEYIRRNRNAIGIRVIRMKD